MTTSISSCDIALRVLICGDPGVGKSSMIWRMSENIFPTLDQANITLANSVKSRAIQFGKKQILVKFIDTIGQERFRTLSRSFYSNTDVIILCYDSTQQSSFEHLTNWYTEVERYSLGGVAGAKSPSLSPSSSSGSGVNGSKVYIALASTKSDQPATVAASEGQNFANQHGIPFIETSSLNSTGIDQLLQTVLKGAGERIFQEENWTKLKITSPVNGGGKNNTRSPTLSSASQGNTQSSGDKKSSLCTIL